MGSNDPKGYYRRLGVHPDAPASVLKAAYRALAKDLHPDRNKNAASTAAFRAVQEAYEVLADEESRRRYDASGLSQTKPRADDETPEQPLEPVRCSRCNAISAQPKFELFHTVIGYFVGAQKTAHQGVFCSKCETKVALRCSAITLVVGWWSIAGFIWTLETLFENLIGGRFHERNVRLQARQAFYFAQSGQLELARAVAVSALATAHRCRDKKLRPTDRDSLTDVRVVLTNFINSVPAEVRRVTLKSSSGLFNKRFAYQCALLLAFVGSVFGITYAQERQSVEAERVRLEQAGFRRKQAIEIANQEAVALKRLEQPLPQNGVMGIVPTFSNDQSPLPPFKINNSPGAHSVLKLVSETDGSEVLSIFVRAGEQVEVGVPLGSYVARIAAGQTWYGDQIRFGPKTTYSQLDKRLQFTVEGNQLLGNEITLTRVRNGNLKELPLAAADF